MKGAIETMVGVVLIAFMAVLSTAYISASLNTQKAQAYHSTVVQRLKRVIIMQRFWRNVKRKRWKTDMKIWIFRL